MAELKSYVKNKLKGASRIAVLSVGSELRADDSAGLMVGEALLKAIPKKQKSPEVKIFMGATAPENLTGEIREFGPSHLIIIDTAEMGKKPGEILILDPEKLGAGVTFSTHKMPAEVLIKYFLNSVKCKVLMIGIQPKSLIFGKPPSIEVKKSVKTVSAALSSSILTKKDK